MKAQSLWTEDIVIPTGTLISSNGVSKFYETTQDVTLNTYSASEKIKYVKQILYMPKCLISGLILNNL